MQFFSDQNVLLVYIGLFDLISAIFIRIQDTQVYCLKYPALKLKKKTKTTKNIASHYSCIRAENCLAIIK